MHSGTLKLFSSMTKAQRRRWLVRLVELAIEMAAMSVAGILVALIVSACLKALGVA